MSKAEQVAKRRYPQRLHSDLHHAGYWAFRAGVAWALPEVPDDAVIEAMAEAAAQFWAVSDTPEDVARAAYAALRGAMQ